MRGVPSSDAVVVDLTAGAAGTGVSHLPEVILHAAWKDTSLLHPERMPHGQIEKIKLKSILFKGNNEVVENQGYEHYITPSII